MSLAATHEPGAQTTGTAACIICGAPVPQAHYTHLDGGTDICPLAGFAACLERAAEAARDRREAAATDSAAGAEEGTGESPIPASAADSSTAPGGAVPPASPGAVPDGEKAVA